jgi:hypothetical protein
MVQDAKADLPAFEKMLAAMPGPLGRTTSVDACGRRFERGIGRRAKRINVPGWVGALRWLRPLITTPLAEREFRKNAPTVLPEMDAEVAGLGRSLSARVQALGQAGPGE